MGKVLRLAAAMAGGILGGEPEIERAAPAPAPLEGLLLSGTLLIILAVSVIVTMALTCWLALGLVAGSWLRWATMRVRRGGGKGLGEVWEQWPLGRDRAGEGTAPGAGP